MDGRRFDELTRTLATVNSRRGVLAGFLFGTISGALAVPRSLRGLAGGTTHGDRIDPELQSDPSDCDDCTNDAQCNDGELCTIDTCEDGRCVHRLIDCDDGDPCTKDRCEGGQCFHSPIENCSDLCCNPDTQFCCLVGPAPTCCTLGLHRCEWDKGCVVK
jgi:hypothetical protein